MANELLHKDLTDQILKAFYKVYNTLGSGFLEKVYENALAHRLRKHGLTVEQQFPLNVLDEDGTLLGNYFADLYVENCLIVELKAVRTVADEHVAQILGYLRSSRIETGLLINFGGQKLYVKKYLMSLHPVEPQNVIE